MHPVFFTLAGPVTTALLAAALVSACATAQAPVRQADGSLASCEGASACVSSQSPAGSESRIEPLRFAGDSEAARKRLLAILAALPRVRVVVSVPNYVHVEVKSQVTGHINDVEFLFAPTEPRIDVRAASRGGSLSGEDNRVRIESIRQGFGAP